MTCFRNLVRNRRWLAMMIVAAALCVRAMVPAGFMVGADNPAHAITVQICSGGELKALTLALPGHGHAHDAASAHDEQCAFTSLAMGATGAADPLQLALAFLVIIALGLVPTTVAAMPARDHVRPPLRGPPGLA